MAKGRNTDYTSSLFRVVRKWENNSTQSNQKRLIVYLKNKIILSIK